MIHSLQLRDAIISCTRDTAARERNYSMDYGLPDDDHLHGQVHYTNFARPDGQMGSQPPISRLVYGSIGDEI